MLPTPLAPLDPHKTRALTTIYAPRKLRTRPNRTAQTRMIENDIKPTLSPFRPLPDIGQKERTKTKVIVFDLKKEPDKPVRLLNPLTPLRIHGFKQPQKLLRENTFHGKPLLREDTFDEKPHLLREDTFDEKPHLLRENTYDVLEPVYLETSSKRTPETYRLDGAEEVSPKTRFKNAALQVAKLSSLPETGKLLCLRERQTFNLCPMEDKSVCRLEQLPQSPVQKLNKLSEIFQNLEMKGRCRDKIKKENSWF